MWILFTRALTASTSTTRVSILNVSANFIVTALFGMMIFAERLPLGWWFGAALLVAGSVVIGRRESAAHGKEGERRASRGAQADDGDDTDPVAKPLGSGQVELSTHRGFRDESDSSESGHEGDGAEANERYTDEVDGKPSAESQ